MISKSLERVSNWKSVLAAIVYFATFLAMTYGGFALTRGDAFFESFVSAFPAAFAACFVLFVLATAFESLAAALKRTRQEAKRTPVHTYAHR